MTTFHDFTVDGIDGRPVDLSTFAGQTALVVNVASQCGLTPQYEGLEALYRARKDDGFVVLGFPCNQFLAQEPGTNDEIQAFACERYDATFPLFSKIDVNGDDAAALYVWMKAEQPGDGESSDITWNFEKFLVDPDGQVVARFAPTVTPEQVAEELPKYL